MRKLRIGLLGICAAAIGFTAVSYADPQPFGDIAGHWGSAAIVQAYDRGYAAGYPDGTFKPDLPITRAEFAALLATALEGAEPGEYGELDALVAYMAEKGLYKEGDYYPIEWDRGLSRGEMARMAVRAAELAAHPAHIHPTAGQQLMDILERYSLNGDFVRQDEPSALLIPEYMLTAVESGLIRGMWNHSIQSNETATRAQAVAVIERVLGVLNEEALDQPPADLKAGAETAAVLARLVRENASYRILGDQVLFSRNDSDPYSADYAPFAGTNPDLHERLYTLLRSLEATGATFQARYLTGNGGAVSIAQPYNLLLAFSARGDRSPQYAWSFFEEPRQLNFTEEAMHMSLSIIPHYQSYSHLLAGISDQADLLMGNGAGSRVVDYIHQTRQNPGQQIEPVIIGNSRIHHHIVQEGNPNLLFYFSVASSQED